MGLGLLTFEMGGLWIRMIVFFNQTLLGKLLWRFEHEVSNLWQMVIATIYAEGKGG